MKRLTKYNSQILRYGIAIVFLWFGVSQVIDPANYLGYLPDFLFNHEHSQTIVIFNGIFEIIASILLIVGFKTRIIAAILAIHIAIITLEMGFNPTGIRDFGLTIATLVVALNGPDDWSLDKHLEGKK